MKYHIITYGCQMNKSDSERFAGLLEKNNYQPVSRINEADLIVVNMCSVRQSAVDRIYGLLPKLRKLKNENPNLKTILTGCILKKDKKFFRENFDLILNIKELPHLPKLIKTDSFSLLKQKKINHCNYLKIKPKYQNNLLAYVPISTGCNNFCSYCIVPFTRGPLICRPYKEILKEIKSLIKKGFKEIWLLGQNVNDYVYKIKVLNRKNKNKKFKKINFADLINSIEKVPGDFKFFFTSPHSKNFSGKIIDTLSKCQKFGKYLNLPVQSGDNRILKKMNRNYTVEEYKDLVRRIRQKIPDIKISTDVIIGFPGETKRQFENTVKLFKEIKFDFAFIAKYSPRPNTAAFKLKDNVSLTEKKRRYRVLNKLLKTKKAKGLS